MVFVLGDMVLREVQMMKYTSIIVAVLVVGVLIREGYVVGFLLLGALVGGVLGHSSRKREELKKLQSEVEELRSELDRIRFG